MAARGRASSHGGRAASCVTGRVAQVDMLRGVALLLMFVAQCAPSPGPMSLVDLSEFAAGPLFALLIGVGAQLGDRGARGLPAAFVRAGVRAAVLVALGLWVDSWGTQVDVVLVALAVPTLLAPVLARLPDAVLLGLATVCWAAGPALRDWGRPRVAKAAAQGDDLGVHLWDAIITGEHWRLTTLLIHLCLGILVWRARTGAGSDMRLGVAGLGALVAAVGLIVAKSAGRLTFEPCSGDHLDVFFTVLLVGGVAAVWFAFVPERASLPAVASAGAMTLSVYVVHVAYLTWGVRVRHPGERDASWFDVAVLSCGALVLSTLWRGLVDREPWSRGPIEGPVSAITRLIR